VSLIDLMPTLLTRARVDAARGLQGRDISGLLRNQEIKEVDAVYAGAAIDRPSIYEARTLRHKIVWDLSTGEIDLYDLQADPRERHDRSSEDEASLALMKRYLLENLKESQARGSLPQETVPLTDELRDRLKALGYIHSRQHTPCPADR
jgi:arylsulfatase A-like enzyme